MSTEQNKAVVRAMFEAVNTSDLEGAVALVTDDMIVHTQIPGIPAGRDGFRAFMSGFFSAFPEQSVEMHELVAEGDRVLARHTHHAVHGGEFAGLPPTGIKATIDGLAFPPARRQDCRDVAPRRFAGVVAAVGGDSGGGSS